MCPKGRSRKSDSNCHGVLPQRRTACFERHITRNAMGCNQCLEAIVFSTEFVTLHLLRSPKPRAPENRVDMAPRSMMYAWNLDFLTFIAEHVRHCMACELIWAVPGSKGMGQDFMPAGCHCQTGIIETRISRIETRGQSIHVHSWKHYRFIYCSQYRSLTRSVAINQSIYCSQHRPANKRVKCQRFCCCVLCHVNCWKQPLSNLSGPKMAVNHPATLATNNRCGLITINFY